LYQKKYSASAWQWFSNFFEKAFVSRVNRRMLIRMVNFCRSTNDVLISDGSGLPWITCFIVPMHFGGL
jgi:hypothetical protein